jgi:ribose 5-phosphate isomerase B
MKIAFAADHAAVDLKSQLIEWAKGEGHEAIDLGTNGTASVDYPDYGYRVANAVADGAAARGVALCGSGIGISIAANRHPGARCALVSEPLSAALARNHNDANIIAMGARVIGPEMAKACLATFLSTDFLGDRHAARVAKLSQPALDEEPA